MSANTKASQKNSRKERTKEGEANITPSEYNAVVNKARLSKVALVKSNFHIDLPNFTSGDNLRFSFGDKVGDTASFKESGHAAQTYDWFANIKLGRKKVFKIEATYVVIYSNMHEVNDNLLDLFFSRTTQFITYPYFRNLVSQMGGMADVQLPIVPLINNLTASKPRGKHPSPLLDSSPKTNARKQNTGKKT